MRSVIGATLITLALAVPAQAQRAENGFNASAIVAASLIDHDDQRTEGQDSIMHERFHPAVGGSLAWNYGAYSIGVSSTFYVDSFLLRHRLTSVDLGWDAGYAGVLGFVGWNRHWVKDRNTTLLGVGAHADVIGLGVEGRLAFAVSGEDRPKDPTLEIRFIIF